MTLFPFSRRAARRLAAVCLALLLASAAHAQDQPAPAPQDSAAAWPETEQDRRAQAAARAGEAPYEAQVVAAEFISAQDGASDYGIKVSYEVDNPCLFPSSMSISITTSSGNLSYSTSLGDGGGYTGSVTFYPGPSYSDTFTLKKTYSGGFGCGKSGITVGSNGGSTLALKAPRNVSADAGGSDRDVVVRWSRGTDVTDSRPGIISYYLYRNGSFIGSTSGSTFSYTGTTTPATTDSWGVATRFAGYTINGGETSPRVDRSATTAAFKTPTALAVSDGTTVRLVDLGWDNPSDFATQTRLYRDGDLLTTLSAAARAYDDARIVPGQRYRYCLTNAGGGLESDSTCADGASFFVRADDGTNPRSLRVTWTLAQDFAENVRIERDGVPLATVPAASESYPDPAPDPGVAYAYRVTPLDAQGDPLFSDVDYGFVPADGVIRGAVTTEGGQGAGVAGVRVSAAPADAFLSFALALDGDGDYVRVPHRPRLVLPTAYTAELWFRPDALPDAPQTLLAKGGAYRLGLDAEGRLVFAARDGAVTLTSAAAVTADAWHHAAAVYDEGLGRFRLFLDGVLEAEGDAAGGLDETTDDLGLGARADGTEPFAGSIDEVRLWDAARPDSALVLDRERTLAGDEDDLVAYWRFDRGQGADAVDLAIGGGHTGALQGDAAWSDRQAPARAFALTSSDGEGAYRIVGLPYTYSSRGTLYEVVPTKENRAFDPDRRFVRLTSAPEIITANFTDTTSAVASGSVFFAGTSCPVDSVEIRVDGVPLGRTDAAGRFDIGGLERKEQTFTPAWREHTFSPAERTLELTQNTDGLDFEDTTVFELAGVVAGGTCEADLGRARVTVTGPDGCLVRTVETSDGTYALTLPAQPYTVQVEMLDDPSIQFAAREVVLTDSAAVADFLYFAPPRLAVSGFPEPADTGSGCDVPVLQQTRAYPLLLEVLEDYGEVTCPATIGTMQIFDDLGDDAVMDSTELDETGGVVYTAVAGEPNVVGGGRTPYRKRLEVAVSTPGGDLTEERLVIVEGNRPREQTFTTVSPQLPLLILRDPPGDASFSYKETETSTCFATRLSLLADASAERYSEVKVGTAFEAGAFGISTETKVWGSVGSSMEVGVRALTQSEREVCVSQLSRYATSGNEEITGTEGDVFVGAALNLLYALTDVLEVDDADGLCEVDLSQAIVYDSDGFATQYHYTESHIRNTVIPDLELNRDLADGETRRQEFVDQIEVWRETLALNERLKAQATPIGPDNNLSFSANAPLEQATTESITTTDQVDFNFYINAEVAVEAGVEIGGSGASGGVRVRASLDLGVGTTSRYTTTNRTGFFLSDNDQGDAFTVDVKRDGVYGTPVFDLVSGVSSRPWEPGTLPRDGVDLALTPATQTLADPEGTATVTLTLGNTGQNNEARAYELAFLQESNPDGARLEIGGSPYVGPIPYTLGDLEARTVNLRLTRAPASEVFDYENLQLVLRAPADPQFADTAAFTVRFESPCSPVTLAAPQAGWVVNAAANDSLRVRLTGYDRARLDRLRLERSPAGRNTWSTAFSVAAADLPDGEFVRWWTTGGVDDRAYDLRAVAECSVGGQSAVTASPLAAGVIDRTPPRLFGEPEPADGILRGTTMQATFSEALDCASVTPEAVRLARTTDGRRVAAEAQCKDDVVVIEATDDLRPFENATLQATLTGVADVYGNVLAEPASWRFRVNRNDVYWTTGPLAAAVTQGEAPTLSTALANRGDEAATVTLTDVPDWLTPSLTEAVVDAGAQRAVRLAVDPALAAGTYVGDVVASTPGGDEALRVTVDVQCAAPEWEVNPAAWPASMVVTAGLYVEGVPFSAPGDRLAALVDGEVRGVATVQEVVPQDEYAAFLTVYGDPADDATLSFLLFDASECTTRDVQERLPFEADGVVGTAQELAVLTVGGAVLQAIDLAAGWTWISVGVEARDMSVDQVLDALQPAEGDLVKGQTGFSQYVPGTGWVGALDSLQSGQAYKVRLAGADALRFVGEPVPGPDRPLPVVSGWNWIGYLPGTALALDEALASLTPTLADGDVLRSQTAAATYGAAGWQGSLTSMTPGAGYLLAVDNPGTLTYPGAEGTPLRIETMVSARALAGGRTDFQVDAADYEHSMTLTSVLQLADGRSTSADLLLLAFAGDEVRGMALPEYVLDEWLYFLTVYGDAADEPLQLRLYNPGTDEVLELQNELTFAVDATLGTPRDPYVARTVISTDTEADGLPDAFALAPNYPNPFNPQTTLRFALRTPEYVRLTVYNALGQQVTTLVDAPMTAGWHEVVFEAGDLASGLYLYRLEAGAFTEVRRMMLVK